MIQPHQFYEVLPDGRYAFRVDHHLINNYNTCDRYFKYRHMPADPATSGDQVWGGKTLNIKIALGSWWSTTMELFYREMALGVLPDDHMVYKFATEAWGTHDMERYKVSDPETFQKFGGLDGARLMALEYHNAFAKHHFVNWKIVGAELGFGWNSELKIGEDDHVVVYYGGKPDLVVVDLSQNMVMPLDFKTKDNIAGNLNVSFKPHPQTAGYIFAVREMLRSLIKTDDPNDNRPTVKEPTKCIIMVCARFRPTDKPRDGIKKPRFLPVYPQYTEAEIEEWRCSVIEKCRRLRDSIERNVWTPRESACHLFYHGCMFRRVCSSPPASRDMVLKSDFVKIDPWLPYKSGDED